MIHHVDVITFCVCVDRCLNRERRARVFGYKCRWFQRLLTTVPIFVLLAIPFSISPETKFDLVSFLLDSTHHDEQ
jgi:hypothetical protein